MSSVTSDSHQDTLAGWPLVLRLYDAHGELTRACSRVAAGDRALPLFPHGCCGGSQSPVYAHAGTVRAA